MRRGTVVLFVAASTALCASVPRGAAQERSAVRLYSSHEGVSLWYSGPEMHAALYADRITNVDGQGQARVEFDFHGAQPGSWLFSGQCQVPESALRVERNGGRAGVALLDVDLQAAGVSCSHVSPGVRRLTFTFVPSTGARAWHSDFHSNEVISLGDSRYHTRRLHSAWRADAWGEIDGQSFGPFPDHHVEADRVLEIRKE